MAIQLALTNRYTFSTSEAQFTEIAVEQPPVCVDDPVARDMRKYIAQQAVTPEASLLKAYYLGRQNPR